VQISLCNPMEPCAARPVIHSTLKSADLSGMLPYAFCMPRASAIAAPAPSVPSVKKTEQPPSSHDGSVPFSGPLAHLHQMILLCSMRPHQRWGSLLLPVQCSGGIGNVAASIERPLGLLRTQTVKLASPGPAEGAGTTKPQVQTRAQRAHWRLSWDQRLARNARSLTAPALEITIHGLPAAFARSSGFAVVAAA